MAGREMYPEVQLLKDFAKKLEAKRGIFMFLDFHGHSRRKNTFMYGPVYTICEANYYKCRILPRLIEKQCSQFRFHSCSFTIDEVKKQTARAMMFKQIGVHYSYTVESSIGSYYDFEKKGTVPYSRKEWHTIGKGIALGVAKFVEGFE